MKQLQTQVLDLEDIEGGISITDLTFNDFKIDADRISYRDQKNSFNILVDDNNKKIICKILSSRNNYCLEINGIKHDVKGIESVVAMKKQLLDAAMVYFQK